MKTNPAYAHLAYRKAILTEAIALLRRKYMPDETGNGPAAKLVCEDVMHADAEVPVEEFHAFLGELETERAGFDLEMRKFMFVRQDEKPQQVQQAQRAQGKGRHSKKGGGA